MVVRVVVRVVFSLAVTSCYAPDLTDCTVTCAADSECGGSQVCTSGMCAREGITCTMAIPGVDAASSLVDAGDASTTPDSAPEPDGPPPPDTTMLRVKIKDMGRVTPDGFAECPAGECLYQVPVGQPITLTAVPAPNRFFEKWEEACTGQPLPTCTITPLGPETRVTARFKKP